MSSCDSLLSNLLGHDSSLRRSANSDIVRSSVPRVGVGASGGSSIVFALPAEHPLLLGSSRQPDICGSSSRGMVLSGRVVNGDESTSLLGIVRSLTDGTNGELARLQLKCGQIESR
jgi:hypothetical protein